MAKNKLFSDLEQQIKLQIHDRELYCGKEANMKKDLLKYNYFNIINAFEDVLLDDLSNKKYKNKSFNDFKRLYELDRNIAKILFSNLLKIENELMSTISYYFCENYCNAGASSLLNYLNKSSYNGAATSGANNKDIRIFKDHILFRNNHRIEIVCNNITFTGNVSQNTSRRFPNEILLDGYFNGDFKGVSNNEFQGIMTVDQSNVSGLSTGPVNNFTLPSGLKGSLKCIKYSDYCKVKYPYISKYQYPPMWIIINTLTIKQLYYLYIGLDESIKTKVIKAVSHDNFYVNGSMNKEAFLNAFELISLVRNQVFHGNNISLIRTPSNLRINSVLINKLALQPMSGHYYEIRILDIIKILIYLAHLIPRFLILKTVKM